MRISAFLLLGLGTLGLWEGMLGLVRRDIWPPNLNQIYFKIQIQISNWHKIQTVCASASPKDPKDLHFNLVEDLIP